MAEPTRDSSMSYESLNHNGELPRGNGAVSPTNSTDRLYTRTSSDSASTTSHSDAPSKAKKWLGLAKWFLMDQWFLIALGLLILIASQVQVPLPQQKTKEVVVTYLCVAVIFFITGCTLPTKVLLQNYTRWKLHLFCQIQSFLLTSAIIFAVVSLCALNRKFMDAGLLVGMIFTGCVPTTISSNVIMTKQANGNQALTVVESTIGNLLGPFITPPLLLMYVSTGAWYTVFLPGLGSGGFGELYKRVFKQLGLSLFLPLVSTTLSVDKRRRSLMFVQFVGQVTQNVLPDLTHKVFSDYKLSKLGSWSLLVIIWQTFDSGFATGAFDSVKGNNMVFIVFMSIVFYVLWTSICFSLSLLWLPKADAIAVAYIVPAKTPAMGVPLSSVMFPTLSAIASSKLQIPMVVFQGLQIGAGSLLTIVFRKWIGDEDKVDTKHDEENQQRNGNGSA